MTTISLVTVTLQTSLSSHFTYPSTSFPSNSHQFVYEFCFYFLYSAYKWNHTVFVFLSLFILLNISCSVVSNSLQPHGLQHTRLPCPLPSPGACSNSCPLSQWCHPTISSSVTPFFCPQSFPASGSFPISRLFSSAGQSIGAQLQHQSFQ